MTKQTDTKNQSDTMLDLVNTVTKPLIPVKKGTIIEVEIISRSRNKIVVDVQGFNFGYIPEKEFSFDEGDLKPGDKILAYVLMEENKDGYVILSLKRADRERFARNLREKFSQKENLTVRIKEANKGGLLAEYGSIEGFLPVSQLASQHYPRVGNDKEKIVSRLKELVGKNLTVKILSFDENANKTVFSEKAAGDTLLDSKTKSLKIGQTLDGIVTGIVDFGIFVDLGGLEGLVHISEISWDKVDNLPKLFKVGDKVKVQIITIDNNKVSLSIKRLTPDPWLESIKDYKTDTVVKGTVSRITPFGVFVNINNKLNGLVHISELINKLKEEKTSRIEEILNLDKEYSFKITNIEKGTHKIALTLAEEKTKTAAENKVKKTSVKKEKTQTKKNTKKTASKSVTKTKNSKTSKKK